MHYSRVSIPPSQSYSAPTAVLLNELLKGSISLVIAFARINRSTPYTSDTPPLIASRFWHPAKIFLRIRRLGREVFSPDCWKLSIPAILYGMCAGPYKSLSLNGPRVLFQSSRIICNTLLQPI